jgi:hypothetical protein
MSTCTSFFSIHDTSTLTALTAASARDKQRHHFFCVCVCGKEGKNTPITLDFRSVFFFCVAFATAANKKREHHLYSTILVQPKKHQIPRVPRRRKPMRVSLRRKKKNPRNPPETKPSRPPFGHSHSPTLSHSPPPTPHTHTSRSDSHSHSHSQPGAKEREPRLDIKKPPLLLRACVHACCPTHPTIFPRDRRGDKSETRGLVVAHVDLARGQHAGDGFDARSLCRLPRRLLLSVGGTS